jgi:transglutaminase-like putative cysteine protease
MRHQLGATGRARRVAAALLLGCTLFAVANLPAADLPPGWLLAFLVPGALLGLLRDRLQRPWLRAVVAVLLQATACWLALWCEGPMTRPAALACTIMPPLGFATARHTDADRALALFLSFCVLLVGVILGGVHRPLIAGYAVFACLSLRATSHLAAHAVARPVPHRTAALRSGAGAAIGSLVLGCLVCTLAIERSLGLLPQPSRLRTDAAAERSGSAARRAGLDDSFQLDGSRGVLSELTGEQLVRVTNPEGGPVPRELYLRSGFFTVADLDSWQLGPLQLKAPTLLDSHRLRRPLPQLQKQWLDIERFAGARNFVFVPPSTFEINGIGKLQIDERREWLRQVPGAELSDYTVGYQVPGQPPYDLPLDPQATAMGLLGLPAAMPRERFTALLDEWQVDSHPLPAMSRIAAELANRCRYDRIEPSGPFAHAIENFLFADGNRRGYCMHFASAAALLLRLRGIPCRIGVGLYGGDPDPREAGARMFGSQHAHAWVEVPFAGRGFVIFDPTPPAERGQRTPSRLDESGDLDQPRRPDEAANGVAELLSRAVAFVVQPWVLLLVLLLVLGSALVPWPRAASKATTTVAVDRTARRLLGQLLQALAQSGHRRARGATLERFAAALRAEQRLPAAVADAFLAYQEVRFGGRQLDATHRERLQLGIAAAEALPPLAPRADDQPEAGQPSTTSMPSR